MSLTASLGALLAHLADQLHPLVGGTATAAAIVLLTLCVRLALHPFARAAVRGEKARAALAPRIAELQRKHSRDPERLRRAMADLFAETGSSPLAGYLPLLAQLPVFFVMYRLFAHGSGDVLDHALFGAPLAGRWADALVDGGPFGGQGLVYLGLFAVIAGVATWTCLRARKSTAAAAATAGAAAGGPTARTGAGRAPAGRGAAGTGRTAAGRTSAGRAGAGAARGAAGASGTARGAAGDAGTAVPAALGKVLPLLSFGTLVAAAFVPLAAGLYLATTTAWSAAERAWLHRGAGDRSGAGAAAGPATVA
ncbi:membrane protein insertase YidC [Streptomyces sp. NPDC047108]|uniref:YidC/Oxa1 family membrane protein insertase n=1 Tax=Streptomyces sp. NPDC047108 TaxID=3155025 RepID=UPI0033DDFFEF